MCLSEKTNSGEFPNSLKVSVLFHFFTYAVMLDCTLLLTLVVIVMRFSRWHHAHIAIQSYTYNHADTIIHIYTGMQWCCTMVEEPGPGTLTGICTRTLQKLTSYLHRTPPGPQQVSAAEPSGTSPGISTNINWYRRNHVGWHAATKLTVYGLVLVIMTSCPHYHTIVHIQSYRYNHTHTGNHAVVLHTGMWRIPMKNSTNT